MVSDEIDSCEYPAELHLDTALKIEPSWLQNYAVRAQIYHYIAALHKLYRTA